MHGLIAGFDLRTFQIGIDRRAECFRRRIEAIRRQQFGHPAQQRRLLDAPTENNAGELAVRINQSNAYGLSEIAGLLYGVLP